MQLDIAGAFQWRIRNLPYPLSVYAVSVEDEKIVLRTSNKKYFKKFALLDLTRIGIACIFNLLDRINQCTCVHVCGLFLYHLHFVVIHKSSAGPCCVFQHLLNRRLFLNSIIYINFTLRFVVSGVSLDASKILLAHANNTLIISYTKVGNGNIFQPKMFSLWSKLVPGLILTLYFQATGVLAIWKGCAWPPNWGMCKCLLVDDILFLI